MFDTIHVHVHLHVSDGAHEGVAILAAIKELKDEVMKSTDALGDLNATDDVLAAKLNELLADFSGEPKAISDAVAKALSDAGLSDDEAAAGIEAARARSQALVDKITAALTPVTTGSDTTSGPDTSASSGGSDTTGGAAGDDTITGGDTSTDTVSGGNADDTLSGGNGTDSVDPTGGVDSAADTVGGGGASDTLAGASGDDTLQGGNG